MEPIEEVLIKQDMAYSLMAAPVALQVKELLEQGLSEEFIRDSLEWALINGINKYEEATRRADAGH